jgi:hypothetical protein
VVRIHRRKLERPFFENHAEAIAAIDICVVPTLTFDRLFVFLVLGHGRRQLLWCEVTRHPTAEWLARQITEAFPWTSAPTYLVHDNDGAYGHIFTSRMRAMGIRDRPISPGSPWQNGYAERRHLAPRVPGPIGDLRRGALAASSFQDAPLHRAVQRSGAIVAIPILAGLHHQYPGYDFGKYRYRSVTWQCSTWPSTASCAPVTWLRSRSQILRQRAAQKPHCGGGNDFCCTAK